jgi:hypothetical protein
VKILIALALCAACGGAAVAGAGARQAEYRYDVQFISPNSNYAVYCDHDSGVLIYVSRYNYRDIVYAGPCK